MTGSRKGVPILLLPLRALLLGLLFCTQPAVPADRAVEFTRDVRPILSDKCLHCHGTDATAKGIPLRLASEVSATADLGEGRRAIVPGDTASSQVIHRITATDEALRMPPVYSDLKLTPQEIETLRLWITQGAKWQAHWSFIPPKRSQLPSVGQVGWPRNAIDYFVLERLEREGLSPSPESDRETLLRRVSLDLIGLPPTPAETVAFLQDPSPNAYEHAV